MARAHGLRFVTVLVALSLVGGAARAQTVDPIFAGSYSLTDLGPVPDVPTNYGGLTIKHDDPGTLLIGGAANQIGGMIYRIGVTRVQGHITGFVGTATVFCEGPYNDGGVTYIPDFINGPDDVLFLSGWPQNLLHQVKPGSAVINKVIDLNAFGVGFSNASNNFVPASHPGAGRFKLCSWSGGQWYDASVVPDGAGTYDLANVTEVPGSLLSGGPEGFTYVPIGSPLFPNPSLVVSEYSGGSVGVYEVNGTGDPILGTRRTFVSGLAGAEGAFIDPISGDFLFSTFSGGNHVVVVRGFASTCYPDCDGNGVLNVNDYICFQTKFALGDPYADCDNNGVRNVNDYICFQTKFALGC